MNLFKNKARKGFSLVELVVVIIIIAVLAVAVFAGGSTVIKKSQVSRTVSDLHNFSVAAESTLNENPNVANVKDRDGHDVILTALNKNLPQEYQFEAALAADITGKNLNVDAGTTDGETWKVYKSAKTDAWGNPYYAVLDFAERHSTGTSDYYITIVSAGPNAQTKVASNIECDDVFLLVQYTDGDVAAATYDVSSDKLRTTYLASAKSTAPAATSVDYIVVEQEFNKVGNTLGLSGTTGASVSTATATTIKGTDGYLLYNGDSAAHSVGYIGSCLPVNF